jgi:hypothetical protein
LHNFHLRAFLSRRRRKRSAVDGTLVNVAQVNPPTREEVTRVDAEKNIGQRIVKEKYAQAYFFAPKGATFFFCFL